MENRCQSGDGPGCVIAVKCALQRARQDIVPGVSVVNHASAVITATVPGRAHFGRLTQSLSQDPTWPFLGQ
jgi:hypothetical protein